MKKRIWPAGVVLLLAAALLVAGCGGGTTGNKNSGSSGGNSTSEAGAADEGVPIYPDATRQSSREMQQTGPGPGGPPPQGDKSRGSQPQGGTPRGTAPAPPDATTSATSSPPEGSQGTTPDSPRQGAPPQGTEMPVMYRTSDPVDKVVVWYREKLTGMTAFEELDVPSRDGSSDKEAASSRSEASFSFKVDDITKMVMIREDNSGNSGTLIMISSRPGTTPSGPSNNQQTTPSSSNGT